MNVNGNWRIMSRARLKRERQTIEVMIRMYCGAHHGDGGRLCPDCADMLAYAYRRLDACGFGEAKPVCSKCPIHCYAPKRRERIREIMRWAGTRMIRTYPGLAILHLLDRWRRVPPIPGRSLERP